MPFANDHIGWYAVHVNANDVACMGARPSWFLATVLLPEATAEEQASQVFGQLLDACDALEIELVGGHTEITFGLDRPIVVGAMLGEVERGARAPLERLGVPPPAVERAQRYIFEPGISVVRDALTACDALSTAGGVHAMHDPTEGGLATALYEMAEASGLGVTVRAEAITVLPETQAICAAASLEPLGLLASGALLIAVAQRDCETVLAALRDGGI